MTGRRDLVYERSVRNVAEALERAIRAGGSDGGARINECLWPAIASCGVTRPVFDHAVEVLVIGRRVRRFGNRLFAGGGP